MSGPVSPEPLTEAESGALLAVARAAVRVAAAGLPPADVPDDLPSRLRQPAGVFVSLHTHALRGCIGTILADTALAAATARVARAAALQDPRFPPLRPDELASLSIEISVLGPLRPVEAVDVDPQRDGVVLDLGEHRALLLPQVAARYGWDRDMLLAELCEKAGLARDAWHDPAVVLHAFAVTSVRGQADAGQADVGAG